ncbi:sugar transferase [Microvirga sp. 0TCS3.31]
MPRERNPHAISHIDALLEVTDRRNLSSSRNMGWHSQKIDVPAYALLPREGHVSRNAELKWKRFVDISVAFALLVLLAPILLLIAAAIKATSPGPVLFRQQRYGLNKKMFVIVKFRTMHLNLCDQSGVRQPSHGDGRITPVGYMLRKTSLDELPQLINVLRGDMSLVGPRPHVPGMLAGGVLYEELVPVYFERLRMLPGITGLAQVSGLRGGTDDPFVAKARIAADLGYIENWSLLLDLKIIIKTIQCEFLSGSGC